MLFARPLQVLIRLAHAALAAVALVVAPIAEAAVCSGEESQVAAELAVTDGGDTQDQAPQPAGDQHCIHGHCHHVTACQTASNGVVALTRSEPARLADPGANVRAVVFSLERPPKA